MGKGKKKNDATDSEPTDTRFIYQREIWFISALILKNQVIEYEVQGDQGDKAKKPPLRQRKREETTDMKVKAADLKTKVDGWIKNIKADDLPHINWNSDLQNAVVEMAKTVQIYKCTWNDYLSFHPHPYTDENRGLSFDWLGYFEIELEYFPENPERKSSINPMMLQQVPTKVLEYIGKEYALHNANKTLLIDTDSPIYVVVVSNNMTNGLVKWSQKTIWKHREQVGLWTEIFSGSWPDYTDQLYSDRVRQNLSNRASELHYLRRNSGFIFMESDNYNKFFIKENSYMRTFVLKPAAQIRAMQFALTSINYSIDILFLLQHARSELLGEKIENLKKIRGNVYNKMGFIYSELDRNRRPHYTNVLDFLLKEFRFEAILRRMNDNIEVFTDSLQLMYQKSLRDSQERQSQRMGILNILFGLGVAADISFMLGAAIHITEDVTGEVIIYCIFAISIIIIFLIVLMLLIQLHRKEWIVGRVKSRHASLAFILTSDDNLLMEKRKEPPFANYLALPSTFVPEQETPEGAIHRAVLEGFNMDVQVVKKLGDFKSPVKDPRGPVLSSVFLCESVDWISRDQGSSGSLCSAEFLPLEHVVKQSLAFDHLAIIQECVKAVKSANAQPAGVGAGMTRIFSTQIFVPKDIL